MLTIGCAGFSVPATRYFKEFAFVEVPEVHVAAQVSGTVRRWKREVPPEFVFALVAPKEIGQEGFRPGKITETAVASLLDVSRVLEARMVLVGSPPEFASNRTNRSVLREFLESIRGRFDRVVWEPPVTWEFEEARTLAKSAGAVAACDPLLMGTTTDEFAYYRLPGPAGHKSRYEDPAIIRLAGLVSGAKNEEMVVVFTNVDMFSDAKRLRKALKI